MSERSSKQVLAPFTNPLLAPFPSSIARSLAGPLHIICVHACALALPPHDSLALVSSCPPGLHSSRTCSIPPLQSAFKLLHHLRGDSFAETLCCCVRQAGSRFLSNGGGRQTRQQVFVRKRPRSPPPPLSLGGMDGAIHSARFWQNWYLRFSAMTANGSPWVPNRKCPSCRWASGASRSHGAITLRAS